MVGTAFLQAIRTLDRFSACKIVALCHNRVIPDQERVTLAVVRAGEIALAALPNGGTCMGFVGFLGADNAIERIAGFRHSVEGSTITLVDMRGDDVDFARARSNVDAFQAELAARIGG